MPHNYVELINLGKSYPLGNGQDAVIVKGFDLTMTKGEFVSIIGHSGCGKTTVLSMTVGLLDKTDGNVVLDGIEVDGPGPDRGIVFQAPCLLPWMTAFQNVMLGVKQVFPHATSQQRKDIVNYNLNLVGLYNARDKYPRELSGGMQQRVGIARAFALKPKMLLLDEPFGRLDSLTRMELQETLLDLLQQFDMTAMMVTHDVDEAMFLSDRIVMMTNGPAAKVGQILELPFDNPRNRKQVLEDPRYYQLRAERIAFLEEQELPKIVNDDSAPDDSEDDDEQSSDSENVKSYANAG